MFTHVIAVIKFESQHGHVIISLNTFFYNSHLQFQQKNVLRYLIQLTWNIFKLILNFFMSLALKFLKSGSKEFYRYTRYK